jgi:membrane protein
LTPGGTVGILSWFAASLGLRLYFHFSDSYSTAYGSLGAVMILLTWFYVTGLMLLVGAEINSEIEAATAEKHLLGLPRPLRRGFRQINSISECAAETEPRAVGVRRS